MSGFFEIVGLFVSLIVASLALALMWQVLCNIYGGIKGAYRLARIMKRSFPHWQLIRFGLRNWSGTGRYDGLTGKYYQIGGMKVPLDGRDKIVRDCYPG